MNGNNTMSKEAFARSQSHPRKVELARILLGTEEDKMKAALDSGFNEMIIKEMSRDISNNVEGMQTFAADLKNGVATEKVVEESKTDQEQSLENENENDTIESVDPVIEDSAVETEVANEESDIEVSTEDSTEDVPQSTEDPTGEGTTVEEPKA